MKKQKNMGSTATLPDGWHWIPLDVGPFKLNVGAFWSMSSSSYGGLIRDHHRRVRITFIAIIMHSLSPKHAEIVVCEGLKLAKRFGYNNFTLESDCKGVVDQLKSHLGVHGPLGYVHKLISLL